MEITEKSLVLAELKKERQFLEYIKTEVDVLFIYKTHVFLIISFLFPVKGD